mmetsp:Transcript_14060/g.31147  ORF Transcript_14060/g.31147 Transcript_14060/m.31147 type:complete len:1038 (+) Transcript_14060:105-3218(+)
MASFKDDELYTAVQYRMMCYAGTAGQAAAPAAEGKGGKVKMSKEEKAAKAAPKKKEPKAAAAAVVPFVNKTPKGDKKDTTEAMAAGYDPEAVESAWGDWWEKKGFFTPDVKRAVGTKESQRFVMVIPPPNVTGSLHLGHALTVAIEDSLCRWHRMSGRVVCWIPGVDHAGIATQSVVEKKLLVDEKKTRHDYGREGFLKRVWDWKQQYGERIQMQLRRIGVSVDWTRERFTMDEMLSAAVQEAFVRFYEQGKIFRGTRLVNWCPHLRTALSDLEVDHDDLVGRTMITIPGRPEPVECGTLTSFSYKVKGTDTRITVATTRLETMLGDVAVAVHPEDERYASLVGKELVHPFFPDRSMVVVADSYVDKEFGTGAVKITPAHDPNDYDMGKRHTLEFITIFDDNGHINKLGGKFVGQHRYEARKTIEEALRAEGLFVDKKPHAMRLGRCSRSGDIIEPYLIPQWWMDCKELAARSTAAVRSGELKILPKEHEQTWFYWLDNIKDWCISRQLWWGHRIPAYKVVKPAQDQEVWFVGRTKEEAHKKAAEKFGKDVEIVQDEDVLDTWFSSGLFPFSVFGWPNEKGNDDLKAFFPGTLLETGHDILFFWVARMVMMSLGLMDQLPFKTVYLHAMVRDAHGRKMSKSLGNVIDPLHVVNGISLDGLHDTLKGGNLPAREVEKAMKGQKADYPDGIPQCGSDALRFGLLAYTSQGRNVNLDINRVVAYRHFCNKLWNAVKFAMLNFGDGFVAKGLQPDAQLAWEDRWILSRLAAAATGANSGFEAYEFSGVVTATYNFWLYDFCDVYLEAIKPRMRGDDETEKDIAREVIYVCMDWGLRLLHPVLPYITEELYQRLPGSSVKSESICIADYPQGSIAWNMPIVEDEMVAVKSIVHTCRSTSASLGIPNNARPKAIIKHADAAKSKMFAARAEAISTLAKIGEVSVAAPDAAVPAGFLGALVSADCTVYFEVAGNVDIEEQKKKVVRKMESNKKLLAGYLKKLEVPDYETKVPEAVRKQNAEKIDGMNKELEELDAQITQLNQVA